jgi:16S rRNA (uracil1498-N3)-methyltransferase
MQIFYAPDIEGETYILDENESKHCIRVLRMTKGARVSLIDGRGNLFEAVISEPDYKKCKITVLEKISDFEKRSYRLHIAVSPIKNPERFEWFVEKSVEIGVDEITPIICKNTEKQSIKPDRLNNIIVSAMKQSLKAVRPVLNEPVPFEKFILGHTEGKTLIAHCKDYPPRVRISDVCGRNENSLIMIGPEGDFSDEELLAAVKRNYVPVQLGPSRLRTETAGIAACHSVYFINL